MTLAPALPSFRLDGKRALVTGAGRGIGAAGAVIFAQAGAAVTLCARTGSEVEALAGEIRSAGFAADAFALDARDIATMTREIAARGPFDILLNNAGISWGAPYEEMPAEAWRKVLETNIIGTHFVTRAVLPAMKRST